MKSSAKSPEFCKMKLSVVSAPGSRFMLLAGINVDIRAVNVTVRGSIEVVEGPLAPVTSRFPDRV